MDYMLLFDTSKNEWNHYRGEYCIEKFFKDLRNQGIKIINYKKKKKKEMIPLRLTKTKKFVIYVKKNFVLMKMIRVNLN